MRHNLAVLFALPLFSFLSTGPTEAGPGGYIRSSCGNCAVSKFQTPRYNQLLPYRHCEDHRRYNAAPCCGEVIRSAPYLLKTVVVRKAREPRYYYDQRGVRRCHRVLVVTYKEVYSDGSCRIYTCRS
jgi:hypothetical protein